MEYPIKMDESRVAQIAEIATIHHMGIGDRSRPFFPMTRGIQHDVYTFLCVERSWMKRRNIHWNQELVSQVSYPLTSQGGWCQFHVPSQSGCDTNTGKLNSQSILIPKKQCPVPVRSGPISAHSGIPWSLSLHALPSLLTCVVVVFGVNLFGTFSRFFYFLAFLMHFSTWTPRYKAERAFG